MTKIFDKRISITSVRFGARALADLIVMFGTDEGSNKDGLLDTDDLQDVYIYRLSDRSLRRIGLKGVNPIELSLVSTPDFLVVMATVDRDHDGHALRWPTENHQEEPTTLIRIDLRSYQTSPFVPEPMQAELQKTLEAGK